MRDYGLAIDIPHSNLHRYEDGSSHRGSLSSTCSRTSSSYSPTSSSSGLSRRSSTATSVLDPNWRFLHPQSDPAAFAAYSAYEDRLASWHYRKLCQVMDVHDAAIPRTDPYAVEEYYSMHPAPETPNVTPPSRNALLPSTSRGRTHARNVAYSSRDDRQSFTRHPARPARGSDVVDIGLSRPAVMAAVRASGSAIADDEDHDNDGLGTRVMSVGSWLHSLFGSKPKKASLDKRSRRRAARYT
ncbi:hypothetical protein Q8F55_004521 [Vanrija albida]|uniref:Uncharacterized protein n=1 Tax=Vanrija albida TaxID=181172 RepID=A0ABR3Q849_9TREE